MTRIHLDTDLGGDPDDACALAMLLGWPGVELTGITTNLDAEGGRAGCAASVLARAGADEVAVAAGAAASMTDGTVYRSTWDDPRYWPDPVAPRPSPPGAALDLLAAGIDQGATIVTIGALTNLALLELARPGSLAGVPVVAMGGWLRPPADGYPSWGPERDFNIQCDTRAAEVVAASGAALTLVTLPATIVAHLRAADVPRLRAMGPLGELLARQAEVYAADGNRAALAAEHAALPDDLLNFHWDPVTGAVAAGWDGVTIDELRLATEVVDGVLHWRARPDGRPVTAVTVVDGDAFAALWLDRVEEVARRAR